MKSANGYRDRRNDQHQKGRDQQPWSSHTEKPGEKNEAQKCEDLKKGEPPVFALTGALWHPTEKEVVVTSASDGTLRTWDLNGPTALEGRLCCNQIYKLKSQRGMFRDLPEGTDYLGLVA